MEKNKKETLEKKWKGVVVKALTDESFKTNLVTNPIGVMKEHGLRNQLLLREYQIH